MSVRALNQGSLLLGVSVRALNWVPEGSLAGIFWVGFWGLGGPWGLSNHPKPPWDVAGQLVPIRQWDPEGSLAGILLGRFLGSGLPLGALKESKNVGGFAPYIFGWF